VAQDAHIQGATFFGKLADDPSSAGFKVDVVQASYLTGGELIQEGQESGYYDYEVIQHPARTWYEDVYTDIWGMVDQGYWEPGTLVEYPYSTWVDPVYDEEGNLISDGYEYFYSEWIEEGGQWVENWVEGVIRTDWTQVEHYEEAWEEEIAHWIDTSTAAVYSEVVEVFEKPVIRFSATRSDASWLWQNPGDGETQESRWLMKLSNAGLLFPSPLGDNVYRKALYNHQSAMYTEVQFQTQDDPTLGIGSEFSKEGLKAWAEEGDAIGANDRLLAPSVRMESKLTHNALEIQRAQPTNDGTSSAVFTTRIVADHATFGGSVAVKGALLILPQGDISMGEFNNGPRP
jgi:hypothetical protein